MTDAYVSEANFSAVVTVNSPAVVTEANFSAVVKVQSTAMVTEANFSAVVYRAPCVTRRCDLWTITRTDGNVFRYTSLDEDLVIGGQTYKTCGSIQDMATESDSDVQNVSNVTLVGLITDESITEDDIYGGLFDDARVECWVVPWSQDPDQGAPFMTASGWIGRITRRENSFEAEVLGAGARLKQTALVQFYAPACRFVFGDPGTCGIDRELYRQSGIEVTGSIGRGIVEFAPESIPSMEALWNNGTVQWIHGRNAGIVCQTATVDWQSGVLSLWDIAPFPPEPGDIFDVLPGCSYDGPGCKVYDNYTNFGGFENVPGPDALQQNADALFAANSG
jgi:uncharacterized phage protein (TIGR02218 family)